MSVTASALLFSGPYDLGSPYSQELQTSNVNVNNFPAGPFDVNVVSGGGGGGSGGDVNVVNTPTVHINNTDPLAITESKQDTVSISVPNGTANQSVGSTSLAGYASVLVQISGTFTGTVQLAGYGDPAQGGPSYKLYDFNTGAAVSGVTNAGTAQTFILVGPTQNLQSISFGRGSDWVSGSATVYIVKSKIASAFTRVVQGPASQSVDDGGGSLTVDGTVSISGTVTVGSHAVTVSNFPATQPISGTVAVSNLPATQPVSGTVAISGTPSVSVSNFPATQPVSGTVAVSGTPNVAVTNTPTVAVNNFPATQPVSGTVAVSGTPTVSVSNFPATQPVSFSGGVSSNTRDGSGTAITSSIAGTNNTKQALDVNLPSKLDNATLTVTAGTGTRNFGPIDTLGYASWTAAFITWGTAAGSMVLQGSNDNTNWFSVPMDYSSPGGIPTISNGSILYIVVGSATNVYTYTGSLKFRYLRIQTTGTVTGTYTLQVALTATPLVKDIIPILGGIAGGDGWSNPSNLVGTQSATMGYTGTALLGWDRVRLANVIKNATATASGSSAVWTPNTGRKFRIMRYSIDVSNAAYQASAGELTLTFYDGATAMPIVRKLFIPAAAQGGLGGWSTGWIDLGNGILSATANNVLNINLSSALTAGGVVVNVAGIEE